MNAVTGSIRASGDEIRRQSRSSVSAPCVSRPRQQTSRAKPGREKNGPRLEGLIAELAILAVLMPIIANQAGNAGQQALAVTLRGIVMDEVRAGRVIARGAGVERPRARRSESGRTLGVASGGRLGQERGARLGDQAPGDAAGLCDSTSTISGSSSSAVSGCRTRERRRTNATTATA